MTQTVWHFTRHDVPAEGQKVEVPNNGGTILVYRRGLWWIPDMSMYVYYAPEFWRAVDDATDGAP